MVTRILLYILVWPQAFGIALDTIRIGIDARQNCALPSLDVLIWSFMSRTVHLLAAQRYSVQCAKSTDGKLKWLHLHGAEEVVALGGARATGKD